MRPGDTFDRYRIEATLGKGGMGEVYRAYDERLRRNVALKIMRKDAAPSDDGDASARMLREARLGASFSHPNAIAIFDVGEVDGVTFIAMELVAGRSLRAFVGDPDVPMSTRVRWIVEIARALAAAHAAGLVHRDIKPDNVMVVGNGIKVLDFGIAKRAGGDAVVTAPQASDPEPMMHAPMSFRTADGHVMGTPGYMAPEQRHEARADARMDQYAWGVLAYELLAGVHPQEAPDDDMRTTAPMPGHDILAPRPLRSMLGEAALASVSPRLISELCSVVTRAMSLRASDRFDAMDDVVAALEPLLDPPSARTQPSANPPPPATPQVETDDAAPTRPRAAEATRPSRPLSSIIAGAGLVFVALTAVWLIRARTPPAGLATAASGAVAASASASASPVATAVIDLPRPKSATPAAVAAYIAGLQQARDGALSPALASFESCVSLDPTIAGAHLRIALYLIGSRPARAREAYQRARELRSTLDERDLGALEASEPYVLREPADLAETARRLTKLVERFPGDAELWYRLGNVEGSRAEFARSRAALARALELDPSYAGALLSRASAEVALGDIATARETIDRCLELSPASTTCLATRVAIDKRLGDCRQLAADARRWALTAPSSSNAYAALASADFALGAPRATVEEDYRQGRSRLKDDARRKREELVVAIRFATVDGDFESAAKKQREYAQMIKGEPEWSFHFTIAGSLVELAREAGRPGEAVEAAERALAGDRAWVRRVNDPDQALAFDSTPRLLDGLASAGRLGRAEFLERRDAWQKDWEARVPAPWAGYVWMAGQAAVARTEAFATKAIETAPALPPGRPPMPWDAWAGRAYAMAGRHAEAKPMLERAVASCSGLDFALLETQSYYHLGEARAATGDVPGACAAFAKVLARWGSARPRSITAEAARAAAARLDCPR